MPAPNSQLQPNVAAVDLGSNSFHMLVARVAEGELVVVDRLREMVQLASGLDDSRRLSREAQQRALDCLQRFGQRVRHLPPGSVRVVGTNTLRSARNAAQFIRAAELALGHPIETISGIEEARLIYLGVAQTMADQAGRRLVVDIGGGSTELVIGEQAQPVHMESLYVGCVSLSRRFFPDGEITSGALRRAELAVRQELEPVEAEFRRRGWQQTVGASGTIRAAETVVRTAGWSDDGLTPPALERLREALLKAKHVRKLRLAGLSARRRPVFPGGVAVLLAIVRALRIERMSVSDGALREGLLYDLVGRIREEDVRGRSVAALAERYHVDRAQAQRVESTALDCLGHVATDWRLEGRELHHLLSWAAQLHEIGLDIAHSNYHRHGEYIVQMADMFGFSRQEQKLVAVLVRAHRRKFPATSIEELPSTWRRTITRLAILLRMAAVLHRSRSPEPLPPIRLVAGKRSLELGFPPDWLEAHPLTRADLDQEASYLRPIGYRLAFA